MVALPPLTYDNATPQQRELWDQLVESRGKAHDLVGDDGALIGPFNAMVSQPEVGAPMSKVGGAVRFGDALAPDLKELVICAVGAHWRAEFEFIVHRGFAETAGVDAAVLDALATGTAPMCETPIAQAVVDHAQSLLRDWGHRDAPTATAVIDHLGPLGPLHIANTVGYYSHICLLLNAFDIGPPEGSEPIWESPQS